MPIKDPEKRREANRRHNKAYQERNPGLQVKRNIAYRKRVRQWLSDFKQERGCARCGENHPACLDFHHENPSDKEFSLYRMPEASSRSHIEAEIKKCIVLCANCHRKLHWQERNEAG